MPMRALTSEDLPEAAMLFAVLQDGPTFTARDFAAWSQLGGVVIEDEAANDALLELVAKGYLREIGPGTYAMAHSRGQAVPLDQPLWPEGRAQ